MSGKAAADGKAARPSVSGRKRADGGRSAGRGTAGKRRLWPRILALVVAVLVLAMVAVFSWNRWLRFDDARDFQGSWQMAGAASAVAIDGDVIRLTEDVAYAYRLDPGSKTLSFTFGMYSGKGRYRFSLDRQTLVIQDGDFSWFSTLTDDAVWTFQALVAAVQGGEPPLPEGDDVVVLVRSAPVPPSGGCGGRQRRGSRGRRWRRRWRWLFRSLRRQRRLCHRRRSRSGCLFGRASCRPHGRFSGGLTWTSSGSNA